MEFGDLAFREGFMGSDSQILLSLGYIKGQKGATLSPRPLQTPDMGLEGQL